MIEHPAIGKAAPAFSLSNQDGEKVSLKDFKGEQNVVLYFYPKALTPGCTTQACGIRDAKKKFAAVETTVLGLSGDAQKLLKKFQEKEKLNFDLLSDPEFVIAKKYGAFGLKKLYGREYEGLIRSTFIIGKDGKLKHVLPKVNTKTHHDDVLKWIKENLE